MSKPYKGADGAYRFKYVNAAGRRTTGYGCADLDATRRIQQKLEHDAYLARKGLVDPRERAFADAERVPLADHLADWAAALEARKVSEKHARQMAQCMGRIAESGRLGRLSELRADAVQGTVAALERDGDKGLATLNRYVVAAKSFSAWLARSGRVREDRLKGLQKYRAETDRRVRRRALSAEEVIALVDAAERGPTRSPDGGGVDRAVLYRLAVGTGFRASELASLTPASFDLSADRPTVTVAAGHSKRRREDVQPLPRKLADVIRPWLAGRRRSLASGGHDPELRVFDMPDSGNTAKLLRADLAAAGDRLPHAGGGRRLPRAAAHLRHVAGDGRRAGEGGSGAGPPQQARADDEHLHAPGRQRLAGGGRPSAGRRGHFGTGGGSRRRERDGRTDDRPRRKCSDGNGGRPSFM